MDDPTRDAPDGNRTRYSEPSRKTVALGIVVISLFHASCPGTGVGILEDPGRVSAGAFITADCTGSPYVGSLVFQLFLPSHFWDQSPSMAIDTSVPPGNIGPDNQAVLVTAACRGNGTLTVRLDDLSLIESPSP
jgi:hypothetical protein